MPVPAGRILSLAPIGGAALFALGLIPVPACAQTGTPAAKQETQTEQVIISHDPGQQSQVRKLLSRLFGKTKSEKLQTTGSEVVSVPKGKSSMLEKRLERLGAKVTRLRERLESSSQAAH